MDDPLAERIHHENAELTAIISFSDRFDRRTWRENDVRKPQNDGTSSENGSSESLNLKNKKNVIQVFN